MKINSKLNIITLTLIILISIVPCQINFYPDQNQYTYPNAMFQGRTMVIQIASGCASLTVTFSGSLAIDYYWDSNARAVIFFEVVNTETVANINCDSIIRTVSFNTVDNVSSISITKPKISALKASLSIWNYNAEVKVISNSNSNINLSEIRYAWYIYRHIELSTGLDTNSIICSGGDALLPTSALIPVSCDLSSHEGVKLTVSLTAYHWYYNLRDTQVFNIFPRNDQNLSPKPGDSSITLNKAIDTDSIISKIPFRKQFTIMNNSGSPYSVSKSTYINAVYWSCSCNNIVGTSTCTIDNTGLLTIDNIANVIDFTVSYVINICVSGVWSPADGSLSDIDGGPTCTDTFSSYFSLNPYQSGSGKFVFSGTSSYSYGKIVPAFLKDTNNNKVYVPILYYLAYDITTNQVVYKWREYNTLISAFNPETSNCIVTATLQNTQLPAVQIEVESQTGTGANAYYAVNTSNMNQLDCLAFRDSSYWSEDVTLRYYLDANKNIYFPLTINPRIYHVGNLFVRNVYNMKIFCGYVNKFYVSSYNNLTSSFKNIRYYTDSTNGIFDPIKFEITFSTGAKVVSASQASNPTIKLSEVFDIVYVIWGSGSGSQCNPSNLKITGANKKVNSIYPGLNSSDIPDIQPTIYASSPNSDTTANSSTNSVVFNTCAACPGSVGSTDSYCNLFGRIFIKANNLYINDMKTLINQTATYTTIKGIRWFTFNDSTATSDPLITIDPYTGLLTLTDSNAFFQKTNFKLNIAALISDETQMNGSTSSPPNNFAMIRYSVKLGFEPNFYFYNSYNSGNGSNSNVISASPNFKIFDTAALITINNVLHYCCLVSGDAASDCASSDVSSISSITKNGLVYYICKFTLFPDLINTIPYGATSSPEAALKPSISNPEYSNSNTSKLLIDSSNTILYQVIDNNQYMTDRFNLVVTDQVGSIQCSSVVLNTVTGCSTETYFRYSKTLETYVYNANTIRIFVPDRQEVLQYVGGKDYSQTIEVVKPNNSPNINCYCKNSNNNYLVTCALKSNDQYSLTVKNKSSPADLNKIDITIWCQSQVTNNKVSYFGVNSFSIYPNLQINIYNDFFLISPSMVYSYLPSSWSVDSANNHVPVNSNPTHQVAYKPFFIFGLGFPYKYRAFDYKKKSFTEYQVINWNSSSLQFTRGSANQSNIYFCCASSSNPNLSCQLKNTTPRTSEVDLEPENKCTFGVTGTSSSNNWWTGQINSTDDYKSWFDNIACSPISDTSLDPGENNFKCYDDILSIRCMPNLPDGSSNYKYQYLFESNIKMCIHNIPRLFFIKTTVNSEIIPSIDWSINIGSYIDMRNLLDGFIWSARIEAGNNFNISLNYVTFDPIANLLSITSSNFSNLFNNNSSVIIKLTLLDAYERDSQNSLLITLFMNNCPQFNRNGPIILPNWYPGFGYGFSGYTNSFVLFDSIAAPTSNNILKQYSDDVIIIQSPQLYRPANINKISGVGAKSRTSSLTDKLVEIWWDSPSNSYISGSGRITIKIQLNCPNSNFTFTPYTLTLYSDYYASLPFPNFNANFKPYIKCVINSSVFTFYNNISNDILTHLTSAAPSYTKISSITKSGINDMLFGAVNFPNTSSYPVTLSNNTPNIFSINWAKCQDTTVNFTKVLVTDTTVPSPVSSSRSFMTFTNKFYFDLKTLYNHVNIGYYRFFPYNTIQFDLNNIPDTFVTASQIYAAKIYFKSTSTQLQFPNNVAIITSTCSVNGGISFIDTYNNISSMKSFYPSLPTLDNTNFQVINTSQLCGLYNEQNNILYTAAELFGNSSLIDIKLTLFYFPHFGMESDTANIRIYKWDKSNINFSAIIKDTSASMNTLINNQDSSNTNPSNFLITYGQNINSFMKIVYTVKLTDTTVKIKPVINISLLNNLVQIYDTSTNKFTNSINPNISIDYIAQTASINYSQNQINSNSDNYKMTIQGGFSVESHIPRWDYLFTSGGKNIRLYSDDLENLRNLVFPSYQFYNSFLINFTYIPKRLYMSVNKVNQITLTSTKICDISDPNYYNTYKSDLSDYYNSNNFILLNDCLITAYDDEVLSVQFFLSNVSDRQDYIYKITADPPLDSCANQIVTEKLMIGDYLLLDLNSYKIIFKNGNINKFNLLMNVQHKYMNINTSSNSQFNYLSIQKIQQWINISLPVTITRRAKAPRVQKFWGTSNLIYDSVNSQSLWANEAEQFTYNIKIVADKILDNSNISIWTIDRHTVDGAENKMTFTLDKCNPLVSKCSPSAEQEDYNYSYSCSGSFSWTPGNYQFDSSLAVIKIIDSNSNLFSYFYFNVGQVKRVNDLPVMTTVICQNIGYKTTLLTNQQFTNCSKDTVNNNRYILVTGKTYIIKLVWSDSDSYPTSPLINSESSYSDKTNDLLVLYPPMLTFSMTISPNNIGTAFTQLTYDTWMVKLTLTEMKSIINNSSSMTMTFKIQDDMWELDENSGIPVKISQNAVDFSYTFTVVSQAGAIYVEDSYNYKQYDLSYAMIPRVFKETDVQLGVYKFQLTLFNDDFTLNPNLLFNYKLSIADCPLNNQNSDLNFVSNANSGSTMTYNARPINVNMSWKVTNNNSFNTAGCKVMIDDGSSTTSININACQYFSCRNKNLIYNVTGCLSYNNNCLGGNSITLTGQNFPTASQIKNSLIYVSNSQCNDLIPSGDQLSLTCKLPNIGGRNHLIWLWNANDSNGYAAYSITYSETFGVAPTITLYNLFTTANYYFINYPRDLAIYGTNFRPSCQCVMTCNNIDYYPRTTVKSETFIECDYKVLLKTVYIQQTCFVNVKCLDHPSYKANGDVFDYSQASGDLIYTSPQTLIVYIDEITANQIVLKAYNNENLSENYSVSAGPKPHRHGGYIIQISYSKTPQCLLDTTNGCTLAYMYLRLANYTLKANCKTGNDGLSPSNNVFFCQIISPRIEDNITSYIISLSWDYGVTFADKLHSVSIQLDGLCDAGYYCPAYKKVIVEPGKFCDLQPGNENDFYCKYPRKCMAGTYQSLSGKSKCELVPAGYYLNYFGSDGVKVPYKKCPKGYVCSVPGLPKYYEICKPGRRCIYDGLSTFTELTTSYPANSNSDFYCMPGNYCSLGTFYSSPEKYNYQSQSTLCSLDMVYQPSTNIYNFKILQRLMAFKDSVSTKINNNFISDLCALPCKYDTVCSKPDNYYDISGVRSLKGNYRPSLDCNRHSYLNPNTVLHTSVVNFLNGQKITPSLIFKFSQSSAQILNVVGSEDRWKQTCYLNPDCLDDTNKDCCYQGACMCPPGFGCDVDDLDSPVICNAGFWRMNYGLNDVTAIKQNLGATILDFIDSTTSLFVEYQNYYTKKYNVAYLSLRITMFEGDNKNTRCILCPPGHYCPRGAVTPTICDKGFYCESQFSDKIACKQGYYNDKPAQYKCIECPIGKICPKEGLAQPEPCPLGFYCPKSKTGTIQQNYKGSDFNIAVQCPMNYYCAGDSGSIGEECPTGNKCPINSASPIPCSPGTFQNSTAKAVCYDCPRGYYCDSTGMSEPKPCDPGRICNGTKLISTKYCPAGYICQSKIGYMQEDDITKDYNPKYPAFTLIDCNKGMYCYQGTATTTSISGDLTTPQPCNPGEYNPNTRQSKCIQCSAGYECVDPGMTEQTKCKKGYWRDNNPTLISCQPCPDGTYGEEVGYQSIKKCISCPPGIVCVSQGLSVDDFKSPNGSLWKFCPDGYVCNNGTNINSMNKNSCPSGYFCQNGSTNITDSNKCPAGRLCGQATSVSSKDQIKTCNDDDPNYCYIGETCKKGYFCPPGTNELGGSNSCFNLTSFNGARERFFCRRPVESKFLIFNFKAWDDFVTIKFYKDEKGKLIPDYLYNSNNSMNSTTAKRKVSDEMQKLLEYANENLYNSTNYNFTSDKIPNSLIDRKLQSNSSIYQPPIYDVECTKFIMDTYESKLITLDFSSQNGFPPDNYDLLFTINEISTNTSSTFFLFDKEYYGSYSEVPLYPDAKLFLTKNNFIFTLKILAQLDISVRISIVYFKGPFFNPYYKNEFKFCDESMITVRNSFTSEQEELNKKKNLLFYFSVSKSFIQSSINQPSNMMYYRDANNSKINNLYAAAISLHDPMILDFLDYKKYSSTNDSILDEKKDYYIYKPIQVETTPDDSDNIFLKNADLNKIFKTKSGTSGDTDHLITTYLPFITNCKVLGEHITFKNMIEHPNCTLVQESDTINFSFMDLFNNGNGDKCDYTVSCLYNERFDSVKENWMTFDYSAQKEPLMNISKYGLDSNLYENQVQGFYLKTSKDDSIDSLISPTVPIKVSTQISKIKAGNATNNYIPRDVTLDLRYFIDPITKIRSIISAKLLLDSFEILMDKDSAAIQYKKDYYSPDSNKLSFKLWKFFRENNINSYMNDITDFIFLNYYKSTTQYKKYFPNYTEYENVGNTISKASFSTPQISNTGSVNTNVDSSSLSQMLNNMAIANFDTAASSKTFKSPPYLPEKPLDSAKNISDTYAQQYEESYKDYAYNLYNLENHFYNFHVVIKQATWLEVLNYNAFPLANYVGLTMFILVLISTNYVIYWLSYRLKSLSTFFRVKLNKFSVQKLEKMNFFSNYSSMTTLKIMMKIIKNNLVAHFMITIPVISLLILFVLIFSISDWFKFLPSNYEQKPSDYHSVMIEKKSDPGVEAMLLTNILGRLGIANLSLGIFLIFQGTKLIKPNYSSELIEKNLVTEKEIKIRNVERLEINYTLFTIIFILFTISTQFINFFFISPYYEVILVCLYQLLIQPLILNLYEEYDNVLLFIISTIISITNYNLISWCNELNTILLLILLNQFLKFIRMVYYKGINNFFKTLLKWTVMKKNWKEKLMDKMNKQEVHSDEPENIALNSNMRLLSIICSDISIGLIIIPSSYYWSIIDEISLKIDEKEIFNIRVFILIVIISLLFDVVNYLFIIESSSIRDQYYCINSIFSESNVIYECRNSKLGLSSTSNINDHRQYRRYDPKYEGMLRLGFSSQLFYINIIIGWGYTLIILGIDYIIEVKLIPWYDSLFFVLLAALFLIYFVLDKIGYKIFLKYKLWWNVEIEKNMTENIRKIKEDKLKRDENEIDNCDNNSHSLDHIIARVRNKIVDIWENETTTFDEKKIMIDQMISEIKLYSALHKNYKKEINLELENNVKQNINAKMNQNFANIQQNYDDVPQFSNYFTNLAIVNSNREMDLVLNEMTGDSISKLIDVENRYKVRHDIMTNLNHKFPNKFAEDIGIKLRKKRDDLDDEGGNVSMLYEDEEFLYGKEYLDSKYEPTRPIFLTGLQTEFIQNRRTTYRNMFTTENYAK